MADRNASPHQVAVEVGQVYEDLDAQGHPNGRLCTVLAVGKYVVLYWGAAGEAQVPLSRFQSRLDQPFGWKLAGFDHAVQRLAT